MRLAAAIALCALLWPSAAAAQQNCGKHADVVDFLATKHAEQPRFAGLTDSNWLVELFTSKGGETWTVVVTNAVGLACIRASGKNWRPVAPKPKGTKA